MISRRLPAMDVLKCFAIFLVLMGHCIQHLVSSHYSDELGYRLIYSFHMPLFMMITGYFFVRTLRGTFFETIRKKFRQLILPVLTWGFVFTVLKQVMVGFPSLSAFAGTYLYGFWFLKSAFVCCVLAYPVFATSGAKMLWGGVIALSISQLCDLYYMQLPFMFPCFMAGGFMAVKDSRFKSVIRFARPILVIFIVLLLFLSPDIYMASKEALEMPIWQITLSGALLRIYLIVLGLVGAMLFIAIFNKTFNELPDNRFSKVSAEIGRYTLGIYILQTFILEWFMAKHINFDALNPWLFNLLVVPLLSLLLLAVCYIPLKLIKRNHILSFLFLGQPLAAHQTAQDSKSYNG